MAALTETLAVASVESAYSRLRTRPVVATRPPNRPPLHVLIESPATRQKAKSTGRLDPVRLLEPARKKLSTLEAQRVMGAMRDVVRRAEAVVSLPFVLQHLEDYRGLFEDDLVRGLESHRALLTASGPRALEEMFCEAADQQSSDGESGRTISEAEEDDGIRREADGSHSGKDGRPFSGKQSGDLFRRRGQSSELGGRSGGSGRLADEDEDVGSDWQSRRIYREQTDLDGRSELGRQTMTTSKSSRDAYWDEEEEEEEGEEEWSEGNEMSPTLRGAIREQSLGKEDTEISQLFAGASKSSASLSIGPGERTLTRMEIPPQNLAAVVASCRNVLRLFPLNQKPILEVLKECEDSWKDKSSHMIQCLRDLRDILMTMLLVSPVEERDKALCLRELLEKERYNTEVIAKLSAELSAAEDEKNEAIRMQNDVIRKLQSNLHSIEKTSEESIRRMKLQAEKQETIDKKNNEGKMARLQQDLCHVQAQYNNLKEEHRDKEVALRRRKYQVETEVENWIQKFDMDMGERQDEYERIDAVYTEEKRQLNELEEKFRRLDAEYQRIQEERRVARHRRDSAERQLKTCIRAATTIQAFWRSFKVRKAIRAKKKKKTKTTKTAKMKGGKKGKK